MKKRSIKSEDPSINFRLPKELRDQVVKEAELLNSTVSNYIRNHLIEFLSGRLYEKEILFYQNLQFINSTEFLQLVTWVFSKRGNEKYTSKDIQLNDYIKTIKKLESNLPDAIIIEFDKVLMDLIRFQNDTSSYRIFNFCGNGYSKPIFDYDKLESFLLNEVDSSFVSRFSYEIIN